MSHFDLYFISEHIYWSGSGLDGSLSTYKCRGALPNTKMYNRKNAQKQIRFFLFVVCFRVRQHTLHLDVEHICTADLSLYFVVTAYSKCCRAMLSYAVARGGIVDAKSGPLALPASVHWVTLWACSIFHFWLPAGYPRAARGGAGHSFFSGRPKRHFRRRQIVFDFPGRTISGSPLAARTARPFACWRRAGTNLEGSRRRC